jgi:3-phenylpropionate/trans-cinnamate dioxygenase ferredoxin component
MSENVEDELVPIARQGDVPDGEIRAFNVGNQRIALAKSEGNVYAFRDECSHDDCPLSSEGYIEGQELICECHGSAFDLASGAPTTPPANRPLEMFDVDIRGDDIVIRLPA